MIADCCSIILWPSPAQNWFCPDNIKLYLLPSRLNIDGFCNCSQFSNYASETTFLVADYSFRIHSWACAVAAKHVWYQIWVLQFAGPKFPFRRFEAFFRCCHMVITCFFAHMDSILLEGDVHSLWKQVPELARQPATAGSPVLQMSVTLQHVVAGRGGGFSKSRNVFVSGLGALRRHSFWAMRRVCNQVLFSGWTRWGFRTWGGHTDCQTFQKISDALDLWATPLSARCCPVKNSRRNAPRAVLHRQRKTRKGHWDLVDWCWFVVNGYTALLFGVRERYQKNLVCSSDCRVQEFWRHDVGWFTAATFSVAPSLPLTPFELLQLSWCFYWNAWQMVLETCEQCAYVPNIEPQVACTCRFLPLQLMFPIVDPMI